MSRQDSDDRKEFVGQIIDVFEDFLSNRNVRLDNKLCEVGSDEAVIYGRNYVELNKQLGALVDAWI